MSWMLSIWVAAALLALCRGENTVHEGNSLSTSGYHLCIRNETRNVTYLAMHKDPYTVTKPCDGWLPWTSCTVTLYRMTYQIQYKTVMQLVTRCCDGYVEVGRYCALPVNRSGEFTAKPGSCPSADGLDPGSGDCEWDMDCPGWQKCCQRSNRSLCSNPASPAHYSANGGYRFNATVTVKADYEQLMSKDNGHLNHTRLLQAMVTGALESNVSVYYLGTWPVHPYRTATSLLIECTSTLSLYNVTSKLHLLLKHIQEVSSVTVEDVNECAESALRQCSPQAQCNNTEGSYHCACHQGYIDVDPSNLGANCTAYDVPTTTELMWTMNPTNTPASNATQEPQGNSTTGLYRSTETSMTTALTNASSVPHNSSQALQWTSSAPSSTVQSPLLTTTCSPSSITRLWLANVTGTSFCVYWSSQFQTNQTYRVLVRCGSADIQVIETNQTMMEVIGLLPGGLYNVTVTPCACGRQGIAHHISVRTDAHTLDATARLTNINFTADLQNSSSQAYLNLTRSIKEEIYQSLSPELKDMVDSGLVRIEIRGFSLGSVVVNFTIVFTPSQSQDVRNVSTALLHSLMNSTKYHVDRNNTSVNDFDECTSGENDCSQWALCKNTWASYSCVCRDGFVDNNPERPGRACQANATITPAIFSTVSTTPFSQIIPTTTTPSIPTAMVPTSYVVSTTIPLTTLVSDATTTTAPTATTTTPTTTTTAPTTTTTAPTTTTTTSTTITTAPTTTTTAPTANIITTTRAMNTNAPTTTTVALPTTPTTTNTPTTTTTAPTTTITAPITTTTTSTTITTPPTTTTTAPTANIITTTRAMNTNAPTTTTVALPTTPTTTNTPTTTTTTPPTSTTTTTTMPTTITTTPTTTTTALSTTTTAFPTSTITTTTTPTTTTTALPTSLPTTTTVMTSMTSTPTTVATSPTTTVTALTTSTMVQGDASISVQCRASAITVTIVKEFLQRANIRESALYLGSPECGVNGDNATHVQLTVAWNECATARVHNETHFTASVTLFNNMDQYISPSGALEAPRTRLEVPIMCTYLRSMLISADYGSMGHDMFTDLIVASGSFQVTVQLMNGTMPLPHNYSLSPDEAVVVEVSLNTSSDEIRVVINKCWATPTSNPRDISSHIFLENSCSLNAYTKVLMNGNSSTSRVSVKIFSLVDLNMIYLHCQVQICAEIGVDTCVPDCLKRTSRTSKTIATAFGSTGPLLKSEDEDLDKGATTLHIVGLACLGVGLSLFFIIGFVCLFYYQRNRIGHYNFSVKPKQENFTYLVFNT